jgi:uncharacterized protein YgfB (UPF0149 family)
MRTQAAWKSLVTLSSATPSLDYDRLRESLASIGAIVAVAELHGGVCGAVCAGGAPAARRWVKDCFDDEQLAESAAAIADELEQLVGASAKLLADSTLEFEPLLPDDDAPLDEQVQALAAWCQGFLGGLGATARRERIQSDSLREILHDFAEISRAGLSEDEAAGQGQPDFALAELHEYVRVSAQLVFEELVGERTPPSSSVH